MGNRDRPSKTVGNLNRIKARLKFHNSNPTGPGQRWTRTDSDWSVPGWKDLQNIPKVRADKNGDHENGWNDVESGELGGINKMNTILIGSGISGRQVLSQLPWYSNLEFPSHATSSKFTRNHTQEASSATASSDYMSAELKKASFRLKIINFSHFSSNHDNLLAIDNLFDLNSKLDSSLSYNF